MLCLHADGGYCLEAKGAACCGESHREAEDVCCGTHAEHSAKAVGIEVRCEHGCDCTHLALPNLTPATGKVSQAKSSEQNLDLSSGVVSPTALLSAAISDRGASPAPLAFGGRSAALLSLASVMLRC